MIFTSTFQMQCQSMSSHAYVMQCSCQTTNTPVECMPSIVTFMPCILSHLCNAHVFQCTFTLLPCTFMSCTSMPCTLSHECNAHYPMRSLMHVHAMHIMPFMPCIQCMHMMLMYAMHTIHKPKKTRILYIDMLHHQSA